MRVYRRKFWGFVLAALLLIGLPAGADAAEGRALYVTATAYSAQDPGNSAYTASGTLVRHGVIAVDPSVIPLGSRVFIPGYLVGTIDRWNDAKRAEEHDRVKHGLH